MSDPLTREAVERHLRADVGEAYDPDADGRIASLSRWSEVFAWLSLAVSLTAIWSAVR